MRQTYLKCLKSPAECWSEVCNSILRMRFLQNTFSAVIYVLLMLEASPAFSSDLTASPSDSVEFKPATVEQDQQNQPDKSIAPQTEQKSPTNAPVPLMIQMQNQMNGLNQPQSQGKKSSRPRGSMPKGGNGIGFSDPQGSRDSDSEATFCPTCQRAAHMNQSLDAQNIQKLLRGNTGNACTDKLLKSARNEARRHFKPGGNCARSVRKALDDAKLNNGSGLGHAKDMGPGLTRLGFKNILTPGMTAETAPVGAILQYGAARVRGCAGLGTTMGHVEIKDFGGMYLYDGVSDRPIQRKFGPACRPLIGVFVPGAGLKC